MSTVTSVTAPHRSVRRAAPAVEPRPWWFDVVTGHAKAVFAFTGTFCVTLGNAATDGHLTLAEALIAVGAALGIGGGVNRVANSGPHAPGAA